MCLLVFKKDFVFFDRKNIKSINIKNIMDINYFNILLIKVLLM